MDLHLLLWSPLSATRILAAHRELITGLMRRSKTRGVDLPSKVLLCLLSSCHLNRSTFSNQLPGIRDGSMMLSRKNLVYLTLQTFPPHAAALPPGSLFICGHRNVNSLSLSISEKTTVTPTLPQEVVAGPKERQPELTNTRRPIDSTFAADWTDARAAQTVFLPQNAVECRHGFVRSCIVVGRVTALVSQRQTTSNYSPGTRRNASERSTFIHAAPDVDSVFYF